RPRDASRLLVLEKSSGKIRHKHFFDLPDFLKKGDLLVFNETKVFKARLLGQREGISRQGEIEIFLLRPLDDFKWQVLAKPGRKLKIGVKIFFSRNFFCQVENKSAEGIFTVVFNKKFSEVMKSANRWGHIPVPPYILKEPEKLSDYQTIYAKYTGSVAAPTAGLHFTKRFLARLKKQGVKFVYVTLHVGLGTFRPVKTEKAEEHIMHAEWAEIKKSAAAAINLAKKEKRRVAAVGTTVARTLEGAVLRNEKYRPAAPLAEFSGDINLFILPGFKFRVVDALLTNFHLPKSTLLMLVSAFANAPADKSVLAGKEKILAVYQEAIKKKYRFFSFGDAMLIL
ncbi:MAG: tRNA preQ1(34) S-adenosylmethionine ribosyltransferase-isomerase QueA, partial [Candidatus Magasanikbacteria bacterium]|nr:tRNA preQ1(34) S-adenosylmethionine ribosyltransferase-isomerase QueA [Candidatus Magasanikbacteria bacterium]